MKRISMIGSMPPIKGISKYTLGLCSELVKHYHINFLSFRSIYPRFLYPGNPIDPSSPEPDIPGLYISRKLTWYNPFSWIAAGLGIETDMVHAQWWSYVLAPVYFIILAIARLRGKSTLLTVHNVVPHEANRITRLLNSIVIRQADHIIVHTEDNRRSFLALYGNRFSDKQVHIIPHGLISHERKGTISREKVREDLGIQESETAALIFGNIRDYKGVDISLKAWGELIRSGFSGKLIIAGKIWGDWQPYQEIINQYQLDDSLILNLEYINDEQIEEYFSAADIVLLNYRNFEAQSGVGSVALGWDIPLLVSPCGGLPDYVDHNRMAICPPEPPAVAEAVKAIVGSPEIRESIIGSMRAARARLSWKEIARQTADLYRRVF
jgi:glycosyltransferase involved in cell wall biosynthesis